MVNVLIMVRHLVGQLLDQHSLNMFPEEFVPLWRLGYVFPGDFQEMTFICVTLG